MSILRGRLSNFKFSKVHNIFESVAFLEPSAEALIYEGKLRKLRLQL